MNNIFEQMLSRYPIISDKDRQNAIYEVMYIRKTLENTGYPRVLMFSWPAGYCTVFGSTPL